MNINLSELKTLDMLLTKLPIIIDYYETQIQEVETILSIRGKPASTALTEQTSWPIRFKFMKTELDKLTKHITALEESTRGRLYRSLIVNSNRDLTERGRERYIDNMDDYLDVHMVLLEVAELRDKLTAICDAFELRGFALRDYTKLKEIQQYDSTI